MKRFLTGLLIAAAGALLWAPRAVAASQITLSDITGNPGQQLTVTVGLDSDEPIAALQVLADLGDAAVAVNGTAHTTGRAATHAASCGTKDGVTTLMLYSTSMATIAAGTGAIAEFDIKLGARPVAVTPALTVKATTTAGREIVCTGRGLRVTVNGATATYPSGPAYDFGRVAIRDHYTMRVPIANTGTSPLVIDGVKFSSGDFVVDTSLPMTVLPGMSGTLIVGYNPMDRGDISATMTVESNSSLPDNTLRLLAQPFAVNEVHIGDVTGTSDTEVTVPVMVNNMDAVTGFTMEFDLPSQLEYVDGSFTLSGRADGHTVVASIVDGRLRATAFSIEDRAFTGNDGEIASFKVKLSGRNSVNLGAKRAVLSALVGGKVIDVTSATYSGRVSILYPQIYTVNTISVGRTPITDDAKTTLSITNYGTSPLTVERIVADGIELSFDRETPFEVPAGYKSVPLTVTLSGVEEGKLSGTIQIYSNDPEQRLKNIAVNAERYAPNAISLTSTTAAVSAGACAIDLEIDNYDAISGVQFDLTVPAGFEPQEVQYHARANGFTASYNRVDASTVRYFIYSLGGGAIAPGAGAVMRLPFCFPDGTASGTYRFTADKVKLSNADMVERSSMLDSASGAVELLDATPGDLNEDGAINTIDLNMMINHIVSGTLNFKFANGDMNGDNSINTIDLNILIDKIINEN